MTRLSPAFRVRVWLRETIQYTIVTDETIESLRNGTNSSQFTAAALTWIFLLLASAAIPWTRFVWGSASSGITFSLLHTRNGIWSQSWWTFSDITGYPDLAIANNAATSRKLRRAPPGVRNSVLWKYQLDFYASYSGLFYEVVVDDLRKTLQYKSFGVYAVWSWLSCVLSCWGFFFGIFFISLTCLTQASCICRRHKEFWLIWCMIHAIQLVFLLSVNL